MLAGETNKRKHIAIASAVQLVPASPSTVARSAPTVNMGRKHVIHAIDVTNAKKKLLDIYNDAPVSAPAIDDDGDVSWGPVILCAATTWKDFQRWLNVNDGRVRRWIFEPLDSEKGRVIVYSIPSRVHEKQQVKLGTW